MLSYSIAGEECFPVWAELRRGVLFVMRLRSIQVSKVGPSSLRCSEDRSRAYNLSVNLSILPLFYTSLTSQSWIFYRYACNKSSLERYEVDTVPSV